MAETGRALVCKLVTYLREQYPEVVPIACRSDDKHPRYRYKDGTWTWAKWDASELEGFTEDETATDVLGVLIPRDSIVVLDFDSEDAMRLFDDFADVTSHTAMERTRRGYHVWFAPSEHTRDLVTTTNPALKIDVKAGTHTETPAVCVVAPSPNKTWLHGQEPWTIGLLPMPEAVATWLKQHKCGQRSGPHKDAFVPTHGVVQEEVDFARVERIVMGLGEDTYGPGSYETWLSVVHSVTNLGMRAGREEDARELLHAFSKQCGVAYDSRVLDAKIRDTRPGAGYGFTKLKQLLEQSNPDEYHRMYGTLATAEDGPINLHDGRLRDYATIKSVFEKTRFFVRDGAVCVVEREDGRIKMYPLRVFADMYMDLRIPVYKDVPSSSASCCSEGGGSVQVMVGTAPFVRRWLEDGTKRAYEEMQYAPPPFPLKPGAYNTFRGFAAARIEVSPSGIIQPFIDYVGLQCNDDEARRTYLLKWLAHLVQRPGDKTNNVMPLVYSPDGLHGLGTGKSHLVEQFGSKVMGDHLFTQTSSMEDLVGAHAEGASGKLLILYEEVSGADTARNRNALYNLISAPRLRVNPKGIRPYDLDSFVRLWGTTNSDQAIPGGRRFFATAASLERVGDTAYHASFAAYMDDPANVRTVYEYLLQLPLDGWHAERSKPQSELMDAINAINVPTEVLLFKDLVVEMHEADVVELGVPSSDLVKRFVGKYIARAQDDAGKLYHRWKVLLPQRIKQHIKAFAVSAIKSEVNWGARRLNAFVFKRDALAQYIQVSFGVSVERDEWLGDVDA